MTIDFTNSTGTLYYYGEVPTYDVYALKLKSKYSNRYLDFSDDDYVTISNVTQNGTKYYSGDWDISSYTLEDVAGYYDAELYGGPDTDNLTLIKKQLCKVEQNNFDIPVEVQYVSDNDDNEQIVYFYEEE